MWEPWSETYDMVLCRYTDAKYLTKRQCFTYSYSGWFTSDPFLREPYRHMRVRNLGLEELARIQWIWIGYSKLFILEPANALTEYLARIQWIWIRHSELSILERVRECFDRTAGTITVNLDRIFRLSIPERASKARECFYRTIGGLHQNEMCLRNHQSIRLHGDKN